MNNQKKSYEVNLNYPKTEEGKIELRNRIGRAYSEFVREYILNLQISNEQKEKMYSRVLKQLSK
ncbi:MAG: hypothetical protein ACYDG2_21670 [Ruminiclostridium sp.]